MHCSGQDAVEFSMQNLSAHAGLFGEWLQSIGISTDCIADEHIDISQVDGEVLYSKNAPAILSQLGSMMFVNSFAFYENGFQCVMECWQLKGFCYLQSDRLLVCVKLSRFCAWCCCCCCCRCLLYLVVAASAAALLLPLLLLPLSAALVVAATAVPPFLCCCWSAVAAAVAAAFGLQAFVVLGSSVGS